MGNDKAGKCEMHKPRLILKHATSLATWKKKGQVVDSNPTFVKIYKRLYNLTEDYPKHTFQAPCICFVSELAMDLSFETINVSID